MMRAFVVAGAVLLALGASPAHADIAYYNLTTYDVNGFTGPFAEVTVDLTSSTVAKITFDTLVNGGETYLFHSQGAAAVNVNGTATVSNIAASNVFFEFSTAIPSDGGSGDEDGYGNFSNTIALFDGFQHAASEISFTLTDTSGTWSSATDVLAANSKGQIAAAQIGPWDGVFADGFGATGFAGDASPTSGPPPFIGAVPAPPSAILLAVGAVGILVLSRRRHVAQVA
jgi:hypothetical protein